MKSEDDSHGLIRRRKAVNGEWVIPQPVKTEYITEITGPEGIVPPGLYGVLKMNGKYVYLSSLLCQGGRVSLKNAPIPR